MLKEKYGVCHVLAHRRYIGKSFDRFRKLSLVGVGVGSQCFHGSSAAAPKAYRFELVFQLFDWRVGQCGPRLKSTEEIRVHSTDRFSTSTLQQHFDAYAFESGGSRGAPRQISTMQLVPTKK